MAPHIGMPVTQGLGVQYHLQAMLQEGRWTCKVSGNLNLFFIFNFLPFLSIFVLVLGLACFGSLFHLERWYFQNVEIGTLGLKLVGIRIL